MVTCFLDTSAFIKRYRKKEIGSEFISKIFNEPENFIIILNLTIVETIQTFYRLYKLGEINHTELSFIINDFYKDIDESVNIYTVTTEHMFRAEEIIKSIIHLKTIRKHPGTVDILQISAAMDFIHKNLLFISNDLDLNYVAKAQRVKVLNPEESVSPAFNSH